jgi:hypothetical protein
VSIKPGREDETRALIAEDGVAMVQGLAGPLGGYRARSCAATFETLRDMPDAPASLVSVDVCEVVGQG